MQYCVTKRSHINIVASESSFSCASLCSSFLAGYSRRSASNNHCARRLLRNYLHRCVLCRSNPQRISHLQHWSNSGATEDGACPCHVIVKINGRMKPENNKYLYLSANVPNRHFDTFVCESFNIEPCKLNKFSFAVDVLFPYAHQLLGLPKQLPQVGACTISLFSQPHPARAL